jgi:hypothetical protein
MRHRLAIAVVLCLVEAGCAPRESPSVAKPSAALSPVISGLPVQLRVQQRSTTEVPESASELSLTVDDITRGQVMVSLVHAGGGPVFGPVSMAQGADATFRFGDGEYRLRLTELANALVGEDFATFEISDAIIASLTESQKIERLLAAVESLEGAVFVRNGVDYSADDAASHLRSKLQVAGDRIATADAFIEHIGSKSSTTGETYQIRFGDGRVIPAGEFLRAELQRLSAEKDAGPTD